MQKGDKKKPKNEGEQYGKAEQKKPNVLVIWGNDIGISNLNCYSHGLMGYQTPNIYRLAKEGMAAERYRADEVK